MNTAIAQLGILAFAVMSASLTSCNRDSDSPYYSESYYTDFKDEEFTKWMSRDDFK